MLIFVHIPKTAGTTFKSVLFNHFKPEERIVVDSKDWLEPNLYINSREGLPDAKQIKPNNNVKFIMGHFKASRFSNLYPTADLITWVRDPLQRIVSSYYYYLFITPDSRGVLKKHRKYDIIDIEKFVSHNANKNSMSKQLNISLNKFKFIGIAENFSKELIRYQTIMNSKELALEATKDYNINPIKKSTQEVYEVNEDIKELIMRENKKDYELYNECLKIAGYK